MRAIVQRIRRGSVTVDGQTISETGCGLLVYVGVGQGDSEDDVEYLASKLRFLRIFQDDEGKMNLDVVQSGGAILLVSNFTLFADVHQGRRPAFTTAAPPEIAERLYERLAARLRELGVSVATGRFGAMMAVDAVNVGPINILVDSRRAF